MLAVLSLREEFLSGFMTELMSTTHSRENPRPEEISHLFDPERLLAVEMSGLMESPPEEAFDRFTELAHQILGRPIALLTLVDGERQFFKSQRGLPDSVAVTHQTSLSYSLCQHVVNLQKPLIITDARIHPLVKDNLAVVELGAVAYAGVPLRTPGNQVIGSFCSIDIEPHEWTESEINVLTGLAGMVMREVAFRQLAQELQIKNDALKQSEQRRDDLVHMTIHDLRTPLTSILSGLQTLEEFIEMDETARHIMDITVRGARSLADMVDQVLDVSKAEAGQLKLNRQDVQAPSIITSAMEQIQYFYQRRALRFSFEVNEAVPTLRVDEEKIKRVLVNLLGNAIRHSRKEGEVRVFVRMTADKTASLWSVCDSGVGIDAADLENIFEKFNQGKTSSRSSSSTGLGLAFCRLVVEAHGGHIWAESEKDKGSTFTFSLQHLNAPDIDCRP
ncbi:MAG: GAF domain-containing sensor histidine kinase [Proteobacteria bacterium]|nr:MAG: GAF domain-containing sensor histidine kinase [Pseudomonadota bacterium]